MFDMNAKLGHWPYRPVRDVNALLKAMDGLGIERALVSSLSAVHFLNPQDGNDELARLVGPHRDRLVFAAVTRPNFALWEEDLVKCLEAYGAKAVVLHPRYHEFSLGDPALEPLMAMAGGRGVPVCVQAGLEDVRRQYRPYKTGEAPAAEIGDFARAHREATVVALGLKFGQPQQMGEPLPENVYFDTSNYETMGGLEFAVEHFGVHRLLFGTNFPLFTPRANVDKVSRAFLDEETRLAIAGGNAERLLGGEGRGG